MSLRLLVLLVLFAFITTTNCAPVKNLHFKSSLTFQKSKLFPVNSLNTMTQESTIINADAGVAVNKSAKKVVLHNVVGVWAVLQVLSVLGNAIKRLYPLAIQPIIQRDMLPIHWVLYVLSILVMAYSEGYKGFQLKFAPMVVERAFNLMNQPSIIKVLLAGPYSMGLFGAERKRMIVSWALTTGVFGLVVLVKRLPYPYRSIVDAGVVVGLSYGSLSILFLMLKALIKGEHSLKEK